MVNGMMAIGVMLLVAHASQAADQPNLSLSEAFGVFGIKEEHQIEARSCQDTITLDQQTFVPEVPTLQKLQILNDQITEAEINTQPTKLAGAFLMETAPIAIHQLYEQNPEANACTFSAEIATVDDYGQDKLLPVFSFSFTRALSDRVNWAKFKTPSLTNIAPHFRIDPAFGAQVQKEAASAD